MLVAKKKCGLKTECSEVLVRGARLLEWLLNSNYMNEDNLYILKR